MRKIHTSKAPWAFCQNLRQPPARGDQSRKAATNVRDVRDVRDHAVFFWQVRASCFFTFFSQFLTWSHIPLASFSYMTLGRKSSIRKHSVSKPREPLSPKVRWPTSSHHQYSQRMSESLSDGPESSDAAAQQDPAMVFLDKMGAKVAAQWQWYLK